MDQPNTPPQSPPNPLPPASPEPALKFKQRIWLLIALVTVTILSLVAIVYGVTRPSQTVDPLADPNTSASSTEVLMVVKYIGGLCPNNQVCSQEYKLYADGIFDEHTKLSSSEVSQLKTVINETDFLQYKQNPNPACASAYDGADEVLVFPQKYTDKSFTICALEIPSNDTAISFINDLIEAHKQ